MKRLVVGLLACSVVVQMGAADRATRIAAAQKVKREADSKIKQAVEAAIADGSASTIPHIVHRAMLCGPDTVKKLLEGNIADARTRVNERLETISPTLKLSLTDPEYEGEIADKDQGGEGKGLTPLMMIRFYEGNGRDHGDAVQEIELLQQHGAGLDVQDSSGNTVRHHLALRRIKCLEDHLAKLGARTDIKNSDSLTADELHKRQVFTVGGVYQTTLAALLSKAVGSK